MTKRLFLIAALVLMTCSFAQAQKIGFINTDSVLVSNPDYVAAQASIKELSNKFQKELENDLQTIDNLYTKYQEQRQYLSSSSCASREQQIISLENELKDKQEKYFGNDGELTKRSAALLNPIKEKVNAAVESYSKENGYSAIVDVVAVSGLLYYDKSSDITKIIIEKIK